jgi:hypothetical protein
MVSFVCENNNRRKEGRKSGVVEINPREEKSILWGCEEKVCFELNVLKKKKKLEE